MFNLVTISREYGSGGGMIAEMLASRLGGKLVDKPRVVEVAKRAQIDTKTAVRFDKSINPWFHSLVKSLGRGGYEGSATTVDTDVIDSEGVAKIDGEIMREAASLGQCVIVVRGSQRVFRHHKQVFHVSVFGLHHKRTWRQREDLPPGKHAERVLSERNRRRAAYINRYFGKYWRHRRLHHSVISSFLGLETVTSTIICAAGLTPKTS